MGQLAATSMLILVCRFSIPKFVDIQLTLPNLVEAATCDFGYTCAINTINSVHGCCSDINSCYVATTCIPSSALSASCNSACGSNSLILKWCVCPSKLYPRITATLTPSSTKQYRRLLPLLLYKYLHLALHIWLRLRLRNAS